MSCRVIALGLRISDGSCLFPSLARADFSPASFACKVALYLDLNRNQAFPTYVFVCVHKGAPAPAEVMLYITSEGYFDM